MSNNAKLRLAAILYLSAIIPSYLGIALIAGPILVYATYLVITSKMWQTKKEQKIDLIYKNYLRG